MTTDSSSSQTVPASSGLRGQSAGSTAIATVGKAGVGLTYRGYAIEELAARSSFAEVAYLLLYGALPGRAELDAFQQRLKSAQSLPKPLEQVLERIPRTAHPMDVLRTGCSMLGVLEPEHNFQEQDRVAERLLATFPSMLVYWHHFGATGERIDTEAQGDSIAEHYLALLHQQPPDAEAGRALDVSMILYAEHEFNASTFACRVCAATLSDFYSCITAGIGTLRGPLHGGANEAAMELIQPLKTREEAREDLLGRLGRKEKIMGFGHAVYKVSDPRNAINKEWSRRLSARAPDGYLYEVSDEIESIMQREKNLFANADFFSATVYHFVGIPTSHFTPLFVMARTAGWAAHIKEQRSNNKLIRPNADYVGPAPRPYRSLDER
ncbi:MAG: 2-methylcitrate synthase [Verrucomicrobia bacterium]|nr:2-methylcitrate synthase [Verrucomicrobiota bacterium]